MKAIFGQFSIFTMSLLAICFAQSSLAATYARVECENLAFICCENRTNQEYVWIQWPEDRKDEVCRLVGEPASLCTREHVVYNNNNRYIPEICHTNSHSAIIYWY